MPQSKNEIDEDFKRMFASAYACGKVREKNMGNLDKKVSRFIDKLEKMKLEAIIEKEIRTSVFNILEFATEPSHSKLFPGEVDWALIKLSIPPEFRGRSPEEFLCKLEHYQNFREINQVSPNFAMVIVDSILELPGDIYEWIIDNVCFVSSSEDSLAFCLRIGGLGAQLFTEFIFLCENLKYETKEVQIKTIAHEMAHIKLGHTKPLFRKQSVEEKKKWEEDADKLAEEWLTRGHIN